MSIDFSKRFKDKVAIVGFHEATRDKAPFDDPSYEIWAVNEEYKFDWLKRLDRHFQLHPRWDFSRSNNLSDPNHFLWLKNQKGNCLFCGGAGYVTEKKIVCPHCENGIYDPQKHLRGDVPIYMQKAHKDIPNSIEFPLVEAWNKYGYGGKPYFTSSCSFQLALAMLLGYEKIEFYGYDMGTNTEYHYQRANFEYWIGLAHGLGFDVTLPGSQIITGELYGYENMKTGYRQQLEMRRHSLEQQFNSTKIICLKLEAKLEVLKDIKADNPELQELYTKTKLKLAKQEGILNFINGARTETDNLTGLYSTYFVVGSETNNGDMQVADPYLDNEKYVNSVYVEKENENA